MSGEDLSFPITCSSVSRTLLMILALSEESENTWIGLQVSPDESGAPRWASPGGSCRACVRQVCRGRSDSVACIMHFSHILKHTQRTVS